MSFRLVRPGRGRTTEADDDRAQSETTPDRAPGGGPGPVPAASAVLRSGPSPRTCRRAAGQSIRAGPRVPRPGVSAHPLRGVQCSLPGSFPVAPVTIPPNHPGVQAAPVPPNRCRLFFFPAGPHGRASDGTGATPPIGSRTRPTWTDRSAQPRAPRRSRRAHRDPLVPVRPSADPRPRRRIAAAPGHPERGTKAIVGVQIAHGRDVGQGCPPVRPGGADHLKRGRTVAPCTAIALRSCPGLRLLTIGGVPRRWSTSRSSRPWSPTTA